MYKIQFFRGKDIEDFVKLTNQWFEHNKAIKIIYVHYLKDTQAYIVYEELTDFVD